MALAALGSSSTAVTSNPAPSATYWWVRALDSVPAGIAMAQLSSSASKRSSSFFFSSRTMFSAPV